MRTSRLKVSNNTDLNWVLSNGFTVAYLIYASLSLSKQVRPICSPLILFLSSSAVGSEGYMERGGPVRQTLA